ncbi:MAG: iron transporter [Bifidobacterium pseudocatenulatum]
MAFFPCPYVRQFQIDSASDAKSDTSTSDTTDKSSDSSADDSNGAGFEEIQVDEKHSDQDVDALTVNAVYFQPIDMEPSGMGLKAADASFRLEADIALPTRRAPEARPYRRRRRRLPDLTVNYEIINNANNETKLVPATFPCEMNRFRTARTTAPTSSSTRLAPTSSC